jgi:hypothetical protein
MVHLEALFTVLDGLFLRILELNTSSEDLPDVLSDYVNRLVDASEDSNIPKNSLDALKGRVTELFTDILPQIKKAKKQTRLKSGFLRNAKQFATFVDLRPNFSNEEFIHIDDWIEVIQFRISTDALPGLERQIVFQCDEASLAELKLCIQKAETKLATMKAFVAGKLLPARSK